MVVFDTLDLPLEEYENWPLPRTCLLFPMYVWCVCFGIDISSHIFYKFLERPSPVWREMHLCRNPLMAISNIISSATFTCERAQISCARTYKTNIRARASKNAILL